MGVRARRRTKQPLALALAENINDVEGMATTLFCVLCAIIIFHEAGASLISSSEIKYCTRTSSKFEPMLTNGQHCEKKFLVTLAVRNGQVSSSCSYCFLNAMINDL